MKSKQRRTSILLTSEIAGKKTGIEKKLQRKVSYTELVKCGLAHFFDDYAGQILREKELCE